MTIFLFNFFSWSIFIIFLATLSLLFFWTWSTFKSKVPFIPVSSKTLKDIEKALDLKDDSVVYDLGCGDGRVLFYLSKNKPKAKYIGIENNPFPIFLVRIYSWWYKKKNNSDIKIIEKDFFDVDLSNATHIFTYLYPNIMDDLLPKFDKELKRGTRLISMSFHFTAKREIKEIELKRGKYKLARKIYVYEF